MINRLLFTLLFFLLITSPQTSYASIRVEQVIGGDVCVLSNGESVKLAGIDTSVLREAGNNPELQKEALHFVTNLLKNNDISIEDETPPEPVGFSKFIQDSKKNWEDFWIKFHYEFFGTMPKEKVIPKERSVYLFIAVSDKKIDTESYLLITENKQIFLNQEIIRMGYGKLLKSYNGKYKKTFLAAERFAKDKHLGVWRS